jgi:hypothetical protein
MSSQNLDEISPSVDLDKQDRMLLVFHVFCTKQIYSNDYNVEPLVLCGASTSGQFLFEIRFWFTAGVLLRTGVKEGAVAV